MPDRSKDAQDARNRDTLLTARTPSGFPGRVKAEAKARGLSASAFIVEVMSRELTPDHGLSEADYNALARYNDERARGLVHTPEWQEKMAALQAMSEEDR